MKRIFVVYLTPIFFSHLLASIAMSISWLAVSDKSMISPWIINTFEQIQPFALMVHLLALIMVAFLIPRSSKLETIENPHINLL